MLLLGKMANESSPEIPIMAEPTIITEASINLPSKKLSFKENQELGALETKMEALGKRKIEIHELFSNPGNHSGDLQILSGELVDIDKKISEYELRWLEIQEKLV
jgi:hypothetical protein